MAFDEERCSEVVEGCYETFDRALADLILSRGLRYPPAAQQFAAVRLKHA
jgi:hypothetical protein